jgi:3-phenylpropionate/trans-cinnamate dioxygenase ferredoxin reductase component
MTNDPPTFAVAGAGLAGAKAAQTLREEGFDGRVVLVGAEPERPYERPPLSKEYLRREAERDAVFVHGASFYADNEIELRLGESVIDIDPDHRELALESGERLTFDALLLATGAEPRRLSIPGSDLDGIHYLRTLADSDALRERLDSGGKLVVVGAGRTIDCAAVVVGVGATPRTQLAAAAGLAVENGILVDGRLQTGVPGIFAAGDVANHLHPRLGRTRVEHWDNALHQGPAAARGMLGATDAYERLPYFFSDQYDVGMEYSGHATSWDRVVFRGDPATREFVAFWLAGGRVLAGMNVNVWDVAEQIQALIRSGEPVDERRLADPDVPLTDLVTVDERVTS